MMQNQCPACQAAVDVDAHACPACRTSYHLECYRKRRCVVPGCTGQSPAAKALAKLTYSPRWKWAERINLVVVAVVAAHLLRGVRRDHLVPQDLLGILAFVLAAASAWTTYYACKEDLNDHAPPDGGLRPDHYGSLAWMTYMGAVLFLYAGLFGLIVPVLGLVGLVAIPGAIACFVIAWGAALVGLFADAHKKRALIALGFPPVALLMAGLALFPLTGRPRGQANTRACYANQKTIVGAVEMYNLDNQGKRPRMMTLDGPAFELLRSGGYLQSVPSDPGEGRGTSAHYRTTETGNGISCDVHGAIQ